MLTFILKGVNRYEVSYAKRYEGSIAIRYEDSIAKRYLGTDYTDSESTICKAKNARVCASPAGRLHPSTPHPPIYIGGGGVGCEGLCGGSLLLCHKDNQLINRLEGAVKTAFHVPY